MAPAKKRGLVISASVALALTVGTLSVPMDVSGAPLAVNVVIKGLHYIWLFGIIVAFSFSPGAHEPNGSLVDIVIFLVYWLLIYGGILVSSYVLSKRHKSAKPRR